MDPIIGTAADQAVGLPLKKAQGKGDPEEVLPVGWLGASRNPVAHRPAHMVRAPLRVVLQKGLDQPGLEILPRVEASEHLVKAPQVELPLLEIPGGHGGSHVSGTQTLIFVLGKQGQLHAQHTTVPCFFHHTIFSVPAQYGIFRDISRPFLPVPSSPASQEGRARESPVLPFFNQNHR